MDLPKVLAEAIRLEIFLANHYKVRAAGTRDPIMQRVLALLGEESMLHATKLRFLCKTDFEVSGNLSHEIDRLATIEEKLGQLVVETNSRTLDLKCMKLEEDLCSFYKDLCELCEELGEHGVGSFLRSIGADKEYHVSLLRSGRAFFSGAQDPEEET